MTDTPDPRVAVYLDFDNIVMSWYDRVHGRSAYSRDRQKIAEDPTQPEIAERLAAATVDVGAIIDYAASFGSLMLTRAYADWSAPVNAEYRSQLVARAVDLVQLFPAAAYAKNGADIRLAVDAVEDMFRIPALTHVVIVGGDSDYVPLAQRCKRLGRRVIGVGVAGSTAKSLAAACDEFDSYETLPGVRGTEKAAAVAAKRNGGRKGRGGAREDGAGQQADAAAGEDKQSQDKQGQDKQDQGGRQDRQQAQGGGSRRGGGQKADAKNEQKPDQASDQKADQKSDAKNGQKTGEQKADGQTSGRGRGRSRTRTKPEETEETGAVEDGPARGGDGSGEASTSYALQFDDGRGRREDEAVDLTWHGDHDDLGDDDDRDDEDLDEVAARLLERAMHLSDPDESEWLHSSAVKTYMRRMDPSFSEKALGFRSFSDFLKHFDDVVELSERGTERLVRIRDDVL